MMLLSSLLWSDIVSQNIANSTDSYLNCTLASVIPSSTIIYRTLHKSVFTDMLEIMMPSAALGRVSNAKNYSFVLHISSYQWGLM